MVTFLQHLSSDIAIKCHKHILYLHVQAAAQVLSAGMIIHAYTVPSTSASSILLQPWFFALVFAGAIDNLCGIASGVAIERDWVVLVCFLCDAVEYLFSSVETD